MIKVEVYGVMDISYNDFGKYTRHVYDDNTPEKKDGTHIIHRIRCVKPILSHSKFFFFKSQKY